MSIKLTSCNNVKNQTTCNLYKEGCNNITIPKLRIIGRIFTIFHLLLCHTNEIKKNLLGFIEFIISGCSVNFGWYYTSHILFKIKEPIEIYSIKEIFHKHSYFGNIPKKDIKIIVDIGAGIGDSTIYFNKLFPQASIHVFEPNAQLARRFKINILHNTNINKIHYYQAAVIARSSSKPKTLYIPKTRSLNSTLINSKSCLGDVIKDIKITYIPFDDMMRVVKNIDLLKVDIEGYELKLIPYIVKHAKSIRYIVLEIHNYQTTNSKEILRLLYFLSKSFQINLLIDNTHQPFHFDKKGNSFFVILGINYKCH